MAITGTPLAGKTLTAHPSISDAEGVGALSYQWQADGVNIGGTPAAADIPERSASQCS